MTEINSDMIDLELLKPVPERCTTPTTWLGHVPFAFWLINQIRPRVLVELGVHTGNSYCAFCEEVVRSDLPTSCFGVDTWAGDDHAGHYGDDILAELRAHHDPRYGKFSKLIRADFDSAVGNFEDGTIDLLHIDGFHTYDAVRHDFETWLPKLSRRAVVLFHDTNVYANAFGVWQYWRELRARYKGIAFEHSFGLGVLAVGEEVPPALVPLLNAGWLEQEKLRAVFAAFGDPLIDGVDAGPNVYRTRFEAQLAASGDPSDAGGQEEPEVRAPEPAIANGRPLPIRILARLFRSLRRRFAALRAAQPTGIARAMEAAAAPFFDADWYAATYGRPPAAKRDLLKFYLQTGADLGHDPSPLFSAEWYKASYRDVAGSGLNPFFHFILHGAQEARQPHPLFDVRWYISRNKDVAATGVNPLLHYIEHGAKEGRDPSQEFDTAYYVEEHPEAADNALRHYLVEGQAQGFAVRRSWKVEDYLPSAIPLPASPASMAIDIVIPVYKGKAATLRCIASVLRDPDRPPGEIIVVDDRSPDPELAAALDVLAAEKKITLLRNARNRGFVGSVNIGMQHAGRHDVVLLNSDTEVPKGWLLRLAQHLAADPLIATVTPFSNNATICSYPPVMSSYLTGNYSLELLDDACKSANAGRAVEIPTAVGFCMVIARRALDAVGLFDEETFGRGYGEENDFCLRATQAGWRHVLACDVYVYHEGEVSFGPGSQDRERGVGTLIAKYPQYLSSIQKHVKLDPAQSAMFSVTCALFRLSGRPVILILQHQLGGGTSRHIGDLINSLYSFANVFEIRPAESGYVLSAPAIPGHPELRFAGQEFPEIARILKSAGLSRVHIHHSLNFSFNLRAFIDLTGVPFDFTAHDYFTICPQINLLPNPDSAFCGEPEIAVCDACIRARPQHEARNIIDWRKNHAWLLEEADRVICPSRDVQSRLRRYAPAAKSIVIPHEANAASNWLVSAPPLRPFEPMRIAVLGNVARHKGRERLRACAALADPELFEFIVIGECDPPTPLPHIRQTGPYGYGELMQWLAVVKPHLIWFPGRWPETYSYTLSEAFAAKLPVLAPDIGAFTERLAGRAWSWMMDPECGDAATLSALAAIRQSLLDGVSPLPPGPREIIPEFYPALYLGAIEPPPAQHALRDLRKESCLSVMVLPDTGDSGNATPCAYIRLILPFDDLASVERSIFYHQVDAETVLSRVADVLVCQRHAFSSVEQARAVIAHCRATGMKLIYDLDDDLVTVPELHPEAAMLQPLAVVVSELLVAADEVWVSTKALQSRFSSLRSDIRVFENALDTRLWTHRPQASAANAPARILYMGTQTHDAELELLAPIARRLHEKFGDRVSFEVVGISSRAALPEGILRVAPQDIANDSYPAFVSWISTAPAWDIAVAPLLDTPFNATKSAIKLFDYAALGLPVIASNTGPYRASQMPGVRLVENDAASWIGALEELISDPAKRRAMAELARADFLENHTLYHRRQERLLALLGQAAQQQSHQTTLHQPGYAN